MKVTIGDSMSIDADFQQNVAVEEQQRPTDLSIPRYEAQLRVLREAVVNLRTSLQILRARQEQPVMVLTPVFEPEVREDSQNQQDIEASPGALHGTLNAQQRDLEAQIQDVRWDAYEFMLCPLPEKLVERIVETRVRQEAAEAVKPDERPGRVRKLEIELDTAKAKMFLGDLEGNGVIRITKLDELPEIPRRAIEWKPIIEASLKPPDRPQLSPVRAAMSQQALHVVAGQSSQIVMSESPQVAANQLGTTRQGRVAPQVVTELTIVAARQRDLILETLAPLLAELRTDLMLHVDAALERLRVVKVMLPTKADKKSVDRFFRKTRRAIQETVEKMISVPNAMSERVTRDELDAKFKAIKGMPGVGNRLSEGQRPPRVCCAEPKSRECHEESGQQGDDGSAREEQDLLCHTSKITLISSCRHWSSRSDPDTSFSVCDAVTNCHPPHFSEHVGRSNH
jgi:hypothetical protein